MDTLRVKKGKTLDKATCCICGFPILSNNDWFDMGTEGARHRKCGPGSRNWKKLHRRDSEISRMLDKPKMAKRPSGGQTKPEDPDASIKRAIKDFCAREKYARFMDTVSKTDIQWSFNAVINGQIVEVKKSDPPTDPEVLLIKIKGAKS